MTSLDLTAARDRAAVLRVYAAVWHRRALSQTNMTEAGLHFATAEVAKELADEADDEAHDLALYLEAMEEVQRR